MRTRLVIAGILLLAVYAAAKRKKTILPSEVLRAETVHVMIAPEAGMSVINPGENRTVRAAVEHALRQWGRLRVLLYQGGAQPPDLIVVIRKGGTKTTIAAPDPNDRPGTISGDDTGVTIGIGRGSPGGEPSTTRPPGSLGTEIASPEDTFELYLAGVRADPLGFPPIWRYDGKNALNGPLVPAVQQFRKAVEAAEKELTQGNKKP